MSLLLVIPACTPDDVMPEGENTMRLYSTVNSENEQNSTDVKAVLLFWELDYFINPGTHRPFLVARPEHGINAYQFTPFNTQKFYPPKDNIVAAIGYSPQDLLSSQTKGEADYMELTLPEGKLGVTTDLLASSAPMYGSASNPFDKKDRKETLKFMHVQSKVGFNAQLSPSMDLSVRNVRIALDPSVVTGSLLWVPEKERYVTKPGLQSYVLEQEEAEANIPLNKHTASTIGTVYVVAELTEIPVLITVEKSDDGFTHHMQTTTFPALLKYDIERNPSNADDKGKEVDKLYAGEAYTFTIYFDRSTLELVGKKEPWEDGGKISIPIFPNVQEK